MKKTKYEIRNGSAIILAIVLTSLLAIIGVLFLISSRVDSISTSAIADNEDLTLAVDTVIAQISKNLALDVNMSGDPNYYADYPDASNPWLACLEPYDMASAPRWRHITDLYNIFSTNQNSLDILAEIKPDYQDGAEIHDSNLTNGEFPADADGDGVSDSMWVKLPDKSSGKGKPVFAAVRIIDNGGMLNVNTGYKFDPSVLVLADGSSQLDINLMSIAALDNTHDTYPGETQDRLLSYRCGAESSNIVLYEQNVIWQYGLPVGAYTPFDISDELKLRNRYIINYKLMTSRIETLWTNGFDGTPYVPRNIITDTNWAWVTYNYYPNPCPDANVYDNRHIATTYNCDRIIAPAGSKMININKDPKNDPNYTRDKIAGVLIDSGVLPDDANSRAAQITANLIDYVDDDNSVTVVDANISGVLTPRFGFERPCIYISEIAANLSIDASDVPHQSYVIELYNPYIDTIATGEWQIKISSMPSSIPLTWPANTKYLIIRNIDNLNAPIAITPAISAEVSYQDGTGISFTANNTISLQRDVAGIGFITVDENEVPADFTPPLPGSGSAISNIYSKQRCIKPHKCIRRLWTPTLTTPNLGNEKSYDPSSDIIQAHPANKPFTNVGEIGQLFFTPTYCYGGAGPFPGILEKDMRINLTDPQYQQIFKYLTVMDPCDHGTQIANESRIKGRININTAPWFVIAQLPWVSYQNYDIARTIVNKRESRGGYKSIGELMADANSSSDNIGCYMNSGAPPVLMTPNDGTVNEDAFEKRDLIFDRISNLVTVRSDVFTAYILVRIGQNGPQKRVIAILDRSEVPAKPVKVIAIQQVPDPR